MGMFSAMQFCSARDDLKAKCDVWENWMLQNTVCILTLLIFFLIKNNSPFFCFFGNSHVFLGLSCENKLIISNKYYQFSAFQVKSRSAILMGPWPVREVCWKLGHLKWRCTWVQHSLNVVWRFFSPCSSSAIGSVMQADCIKAISAKWNMCPVSVAHSLFIRLRTSETNLEIKTRMFMALWVGSAVADVI